MRKPRRDNLHEESYERAERQGSEWNSVSSSTGRFDALVLLTCALL